MPEPRPPMLETAHALGSGRFAQFGIGSAVILGGVVMEIAWLGQRRRRERGRQAPSAERKRVLTVSGAGLIVCTLMVACLMLVHAQRDLPQDTAFSEGRPNLNGVIAR